MLTLRPTHWYSNEKPGWHEFEFPVKKYPGRYTEMYNEIVDWLYANVDKPERHARWHINNMHIRVKFRYERDYLRFILTWS